MLGGASPWSSQRLKAVVTMASREWEVRVSGGGAGYSARDANFDNDPLVLVRVGGASPPCRGYFFSLTTLSIHTQT